MLCVHEPDFLVEKQKILDKVAREKGERPQKAVVEQFDYLRIMSEAEL